MIRSLKDILVVSDMDNTLLTPEDGVPFVNQVTMRLFCALGGHFTVATGRTMESAGRHLDSMTLSAPFPGSGRGDYDRGRRHLRGASQ